MMGQGVKTKTISNFIANSAAFEAICDEVDGNVGSLIPQPVLVIGQEGSGKTTLLRRLITRYPNLRFVWIEGRFIFSSSDIIEQASGDSILIVDNLDYFLERCSYEEQFRLRRFLYNEGAPMMIASVSKLTPALTEYKAPFFEGLKKIHLTPISISDISSLFDEKTVGRVSSMLNLTPPTISSVEIISRIINSNDNPEKDIKILLSHFSGIYKSAYFNVPTNSQRILNILGGSDTGMTIPEMRAVSGLASGILTSYLKNLRSQDIVSVDKTVKRNTKYLIKDPLFRIWLGNEAISGKSVLHCPHRPSQLLEYLEFDAE
jgi:GTPase SAR1 family protein